MFIMTMQLHIEMSIHNMQVKPYTFDLQWLCFHKGALVYLHLLIAYTS